MSEATQRMLDAIPYVAWHGHRVIEERTGHASIAQAERTDLLNHVGTAHAGALFTLAETAGGVVAYGLAQSRNSVVLLRRATANYLRRASGRMVATAEADTATADRPGPAGEPAERTDLTVRVRIENSLGQTVFEGAFDYVLKMDKS